MKLYTGIDLHSNNNYLAIIDDRSAFGFSHDLKIKFPPSVYDQKN